MNTRARSSFPLSLKALGSMCVITDGCGGVPHELSVAMRLLAPAQDPISSSPKTTRFLPKGLRPSDIQTRACSSDAVSLSAHANANYIKYTCWCTCTALARQNFQLSYVNGRRNRIREHAGPQHAFSQLCCVAVRDRLLQKQRWPQMPCVN